MLKNAPNKDQRPFRTWQGVAISGASLCFFLCAFFPLTASRVWPGYGQTTKILMRLWQKRYPLPLKTQQIFVDPDKRGIFCGWQGKRQVCYYHFQLTLWRPYRQNPKQDKMILKKGRKVEAWLQGFANKGNTRSHRGYKWELYFSRKDFLSGKNKRWIKNYF